MRSSKLFAGHRFRALILALAALLLGPRTPLAQCTYTDPQSNMQGYWSWCLCIGGTPNYDTSMPGCTPPPGGIDDGPEPDRRAPIGQIRSDRRHDRMMAANERGLELERAGDYQGAVRKFHEALNFADNPKHLRIVRENLARAQSELQAETPQQPAASAAAPDPVAAAADEIVEIVEELRDAPSSVPPPFCPDFVEENPPVAEVAPTVPVIGSLPKRRAECGLKLANRTVPELRALVLVGGIAAQCRKHNAPPSGYGRYELQGSTAERFFERVLERADERGRDRIRLDDERRQAAARKQDLCLALKDLKALIGNLEAREGRTATGAKPWDDFFVAPEAVGRECPKAEMSATQQGRSLTIARGMLKNPAQATLEMAAARARNAAAAYGNAVCGVRRIDAQDDLVKADLNRLLKLVDQVESDPERADRAMRAIVPGPPPDER